MSLIFSVHILEERKICHANFLKKNNTKCKNCLKIKKISLLPQSQTRENDSILHI